MSTTNNLGLFKHDNPAINTDEFNVDKALNQNWDKIDEAFGEDRERITTLEADNTSNKTNISNLQKDNETNKSNIKALQTDNTTNKQDIKDIKAKEIVQDEKNTEQDKYIAELEAENAKLREDLNGLPKGQASGESIDLSDSAEMRCELKISGNSRQEIREGYNKAYVENKATNGIAQTVNKNGSITLNGTSSSNAYCEMTDVTLEAGTYNVKYDLVNGSLINNPYIYNATSSSNIGNLENGVIKTITLSETTRIIITTSVPSGKTINATLNLLIANNKTVYEQYGASPSLDYPSEVESCGDNINLIDCVSINGYTKASGEIDLNASTDYLSVPDIIEVKPNTTYTIDFVGYEDGNFLVAEFDKNKTFIQRLSYSTRTFTTSSNCYYIFPYLYKSSSYNIIGTKIKMVKGTRIDGYSPYGQGCINVVICNKNLFDKSSITSGYYITSSGTLIADKTTFVSNFIKVIENEYIAITYRSNWNNIGLYDKDKNFIKRVSIGTSGIYLIPEGCKYIRVNSLITDIDILQIERDNLTDYVEHKSQTYTIPTQQPIRSVGDVRDTFVKKNNKWYERHNTNRVIFDGTEAWSSSGNSGWGNIGYIFSILISDGLKTSVNGNVVHCNFYINRTSINDVVHNDYEYGIVNYYAYARNILILDKRFTTVDDFKAWLTEQYEAGTPVYVDYILETPNDIECTEEQSTILFDIEQNAKTYDKVTHMYSTDNVSSYKDVTYKKDLDTMITNIEQAILSQGGNI